jgi:hypothetical protein
MIDKRSFIIERLDREKELAVLRHDDLRERKDKAVYCHA